MKTYDKHNIKYLKLRAKRRSSNCVSFNSQRLTMNDWKSVVLFSVDRIPNWFVDLQVVAVVILYVVAGCIRCDACERYQSVTRVRSFFSFATKLLHRSSCVWYSACSCGSLVKMYSVWRKLFVRFDSVEQRRTEAQMNEWRCVNMASSRQMEMPSVRVYVCVRMYAGDGLATDSKRFVREIQWKFCTSHAQTQTCTHQ